MNIQEFVKINLNLLAIGLPIFALSNFKMFLKLFRQLICPVSPERVDENRIRVTALGVIVTMGTFFITGHALYFL